MLELGIANNSEFVREKKQARENFEYFCLEPFGFKQLNTGHHQLSVPFHNDDDLDNTVNGLLADINCKAEMRNCRVDLNAWEDGTDRKWRLMHWNNGLAECLRKNLNIGQPSNRI
jgi:hypothetical protein